jgi:hypothetical protein
VRILPTLGHVHGTTMNNQPYSAQQLADCVYELDRELAMRRAVYPKLLAQRKLSEAEAEKRMERLNRAKWTLERVMELQRTFERLRTEEALRVATGENRSVGTLSRASAEHQEEP